MYYAHMFDYFEFLHDFNACCGSNTLVESDEEFVANVCATIYAIDYFIKRNLWYPSPSMMTDLEKARDNLALRLDAVRFL